MELLKSLPKAWRKPKKCQTHKKKVCTPLHEHELEQANPLSCWICDHCEAEVNESSFLFHCNSCFFSLCYSCAHMHLQQKTLTHQHELLYSETSRLLDVNQNETYWRCAVCKNTSETLRQTFSYHCSTCGDFHICRDCFEPRRHPIHIHELKLVDTTLIYGKTAVGNWVCNICGNASRPYETFSRHCEKCDFDVCFDCFKPHITPLHAHPLHRADSYHVYGRLSGGWRCDNCDSGHNSPTDNRPWHCQTCKQYDLCRTCIRATIKATDQTGPPPPRNMYKGFKIARSALSFKPEDSPWVERDHLVPKSAGDTPPSFETGQQHAVDFPEDADDNVEYIVCKEQPKFPLSFTTALGAAAVAGLTQLYGGRETATQFAGCL